MTGEKNDDGSYQEAPVSQWGEILKIVWPVGFGGVAAAAARIARNAARAKDAVLDANKEAIDSADWSQIDSAASFKAVLKAAQDSHSDAEMIGKHYKKWKKKGKA